MNPTSKFDSEQVSIFISHASEDKAEVASPLAKELEDRGIEPWLDDFELSLGDSLRASIDAGISRCDFGAVVLSRDFFAKEWPRAELDAIFAKEMTTGTKVLLPVRHGLNIAELVGYSPLVATRVGVSTEKGIPAVAEAIHDATKAPRQRVLVRGSPGREDVYREFVRAAVAKEMEVPIESITPHAGRTAATTGAGTVFAGVDLIHVGGSELAEIVTFINCDFHADDSLLTEETEVMRLAYLRDEAKASKAMLVSNVGYSAGAHALAEKEKVALLKLSPKPSITPDLTFLATEKSDIDVATAVQLMMKKHKTRPYDKNVILRKIGRWGF